MIKNGWNLYRNHLLLTLILMLIPAFIGGQKHLLTIACLVLIYAIITMSLNLLMGFGGQISIGHASFMAIGAYASAIFTLKLGFPFWIALPVSGFFTALIGFGVGLPAVKLKGPFLAVATLGFGVAIPELTMKWDKLTGGFSGMFPEKPVLLGYTFKSDLSLYYLIAVVTLLCTWLIRNLINSRIGRAFVAIRESEVAATAMGINVPIYKALMFSISAFFTGVAGSLYAHYIGFISPFDFNIGISLTLLAMVVVGGFASIPGSFIGALVLTLIPEFTNHVAGLSLVVTGAALILVTLFFPDGLVSIRSKLKDLAGKRKVVG